MTKETLESVGLRHGTDKSSINHDFLRHYEAFLRLQNNPIRSILEIGVFDGASLRTWHEFFPEAMVTGLDIDPRCKEFEQPNMKIELCDQSNAFNLVHIGQKHGPFDLIIDDGSHLWSHQILTFETMFPFLCEGGFLKI